MELVYEIPLSRSPKTQIIKARKARKPEKPEKPEKQEKQEKQKGHFS